MTAALFSGLPFSPQNGDRLVSKAVTAAISALFERTEKLDAQVRAEPVAKLLQGSVDGFDLIGQGLRMYNGLRLEVMELYLQSVSIDFGAVFRGLVKLQRPTQATMRVVLTPDDLTDSFNTPFAIEKLQRMTFHGQKLNFRSTDVKLTDDRKLQLKTEVKLGETGDWMPLGWTAALQVEGGTKMFFSDVEYDASGIALELAKDLVGHVNSLLDLETFKLDGTQLSVDRLRVQSDRIVFYGIARIAHFPKGKKK